MKNLTSKNITIRGQEIALVPLSQKEYTVALVNTMQEIAANTLQTLSGTGMFLTDNNPFFKDLLEPFKAINIVHAICREVSDLNKHIFPSSKEVAESLTCDEISDILVEYKNLRQEIKMSKNQVKQTLEQRFDFDEVELDYEFCLAVKNFVKKLRGKKRFNIEYSTCDIKDYSSYPPKELKNVPCVEIQELEDKKLLHTFYRVKQNGTIRYTVI